MRLEWYNKIVDMKKRFNLAQKQSFYGTHMPILARVVDSCSGPILEMGMGVYSTPLLDLMCFVEKRKLVSYDNDPEWFDPNKKWESDYHEVHFLPGATGSGVEWDKADIDHTFWSVAFLDQKPAIRRKGDAHRLANSALFVILHDSEPESNPYFRYTWIYRYFKYRFDYTKCRPNTTVLSNFIPLDFLSRP